MTSINFDLFIIGLDTVMIGYTLRVISLNNDNKFHYGIGSHLISIYKLVKDKKMDN